MSRLSDVKRSCAPVPKLANGARPSPAPVFVFAYCDQKMAFPGSSFCFCILRSKTGLPRLKFLFLHTAIKNWSRGRPGNEAKSRARPQIFRVRPAALSKNLSPRAREKFSVFRQGRRARAKNLVSGDETDGSPELQID